MIGWERDWEFWEISFPSVFEEPENLLNEPQNLSVILRTRYEYFVERDWEILIACEEMKNVYFIYSKKSPYKKIIKKTKLN